MYCTIDCIIAQRDEISTSRGAMCHLAVFQFHLMSSIEKKNIPFVIGYFLVCFFITGY